MRVKIGKIEIELPDGTSVDVSEDGCKVRVSGVPVAEPTVIETIRIVEVEVEGPERIVYQSWPTYTQPYTPFQPLTPYTNPNWIYTQTGITHPPVTTTTGPLDPYTVGGGLTAGQVSTTGTAAWTGDHLVTDLNGQVIGSTLSGWTGN